MIYCIVYVGLFSVVYCSTVCFVFAAAQWNTRGRYKDGISELSDISFIEFNALEDLYTSTEGENWVWREPISVYGNHWNFTSISNNPCLDHWQGLNCTRIPGSNDLYVELILLEQFGLNGTLPQTIGNFAHLRILSLRGNRLFGTIPEEIGHLDHLEDLSLFNNRFNGQIPSSIYTLPKLRILSLAANELNGTISPAIRFLTKLELLDYAVNNFNGSIPTELCELQHLHIVNLYMCGLSGTIPSNIGNMSKLITLNTFNNSIEGQIPQSMGNLNYLRRLNLGKNKLSGTLPSSLGRLQKLNYFDMTQNFLTGTIPESFSSLRNLSIIYLDENELVGPVDVLCGMTNATQLYFTTNYLTGTLPACLGNHVFLTEIYLDDNKFTGTIPDSYGDLKEMVYFEVDLNILTGTIPESLASATKLRKLVLFGNLLEGTVPVAFSQLQNISLILLQDNRLTGPLDNLFDPSRQAFLNTVQVSGNEFTGTIPQAPFMVKGFSQFSAVDNCLHGYIPEIICNCTSLNILAIDGVATAQQCRRMLIPGSNSYISKNPLPGCIPLCLFQLPVLTTLHLSGNELTGSLPYDLEIGDFLIDLALSHNQLKGRIPRAIQERSWYALDLSYNRFSDTLMATFNTKPVNIELLINITLGRLTKSILKPYTTSDADLHLQNNRLSGRIPSTVHTLLDIDMLTGNLFSCKIDHSNLPEHDSGKDQYECGSNSFNIQFYFWLIITGLGLSAIVALRRYRPFLENKYKYLADTWALLDKWRTASKVPIVLDRLRHFHHSETLARIIVMVSLYCTLFITLFLTPTYAAMSTVYATVTYQYAYIVSAMYQDGAVPFAVSLVGFLLLMLVLFLSFTSQARIFWKRRFKNQRDSEPTSTRGRLESLVTVATPSQKLSAYALFFGISFVIVIGVNIAFIYVVLYASNRYQVFAQVLLSFFKGFWNSIGSIVIMRWAFSTIAAHTSAPDFHNILLLASLCNNIAIPVIVVATINPDCLYNLFVAPPAVVYDYIYFDCAVYAVNKCQVHYPRVAETSFHPPFTYSYQCAARYIISYAPTFVYLAIEVAFILPIIQAVRAQLFKHAKRGTLWFTIVEYTTPKILQVVDEEAAKDTARDKIYPCYDAIQYLVQLKTYLCIILTFGAVFPPIACAMLVAIGSLVVMNQLIVGRYISSAVNCNALELVDNIDKECRGLLTKNMTRLKAGMGMLIVASCTFYSLFLFDILGEETGPSAYWVFILLPGLPFFFAGLDNVRIKILAMLREEEGEGSEDSNDTEMVDVRALYEEDASVEGDIQNNKDGEEIIQKKEENVVRSAIHFSSL